MGRSNNRRESRGPRREPRGGGFKSDFVSSFAREFSGGFRNDAPREMHKAVCADCKQECQVPFKPAEGKPVYCRECFARHRPRF
jgi:CxxC-x17-CxxC domain-containing protein